MLPTHCTSYVSSTPTKKVLVRSGCLFILHHSCCPTHRYNNPACDWDGGDCCTDTCEAGLYDCSQGDFYCNDPSNADFGTVNGQAVDNGDGGIFSGDNNSVLIGAIVGGVVVLIIIIVVVVVVVSRQKTRSTENRSSTYATHTSRPTTMIRAVEVDVDDTKVRTVKLAALVLSSLLLFLPLVCSYAFQTLLC